MRPLSSRWQSFGQAHLSNSALQLDQPDSRLMAGSSTVPVNSVVWSRWTSSTARSTVLSKDRVHSSRSRLTQYLDKYWCDGNAYKSDLFPARIKVNKFQILNTNSGLDKELSFKPKMTLNLRIFFASKVILMIFFFYVLWSMKKVKN